MSAPRSIVIETAEAVRRGERKAVDVCRESLGRIEAHDPVLNSFLAVDAQSALEAAERVDEARERGEPLGPLAGVTIAVKDNLCTRGVPTTCASKILEGWKPPYDAHVVERLRQAGAVVVGKTNLDEFAMGSSTENSAFGPVKNPWDLSRVPGGSSGGSAAAVAAGLSLASLGSDTGGSVRQPGAFCGVTAVKPTYGRVSRYGLIAFASSLDQVGPFTRSVRDSARLMEVIAGHDARDATSLELEVPGYEAACDEHSSGIRVGVVRSQLEAVEDRGVRRSLDASIDALRDAGATIIDVELPHAKYAVSVYYLVATAEASSNLARFDGVRYGLRAGTDDLLEMYEETRARGFGPEVKRRIMLGTYALSAGYYDAFYLKAQKVRTLIRRDYDAALERCDVVLSPTTPTPAFEFGARTHDPLSMYLADIFTLPPSLAGLPAISTPCGVTDDGLPVGVQLTGRPFDEALVLRACAAVEARVGLGERQATAFLGGAG
jgi:aspartyl-tRNA(Asn)/glutamyl-tRNA(Gln) amidotransferase subunit A